MSQSDLFEPPAPAAKTCGKCVTRNAGGETTPFGACSRTGMDMAADAPACRDFFGLEQLRAPNYGKRA